MAMSDSNTAVLPQGVLMTSHSSSSDVSVSPQSLSPLHLRFLFIHIPEGKVIYLMLNIANHLPAKKQNANKKKYWPEAHRHWELLQTGGGSTWHLVEGLQGLRSPIGYTHLEPLNCPKTSMPLERCCVTQAHVKATHFFKTLLIQNDFRWQFEQTIIYRESDREEEILPYRGISARVTGCPQGPGTHFAVDWCRIINFPHLSSGPPPLRKTNNDHRYNNNLQFQHILAHNFGITQKNKQKGTNFSTSNSVPSTPILMKLCILTRGPLCSFH